MSTRDDTQRQRPRQHSQEDSMQLPQPSQELPQASEEETEASEEETETPLESSANLKTTGLDENDVDYSTHHRNNLPQHLKIKRDEAEKMKRDIARQWSALSDDKKIEWWNKFEHLLEGEINMEGAFFKTPLSEMEEYYENAWKDSKNHQRGGLGKCHRKESAIIFALDYCFEAYNKGNALYFFKFTGEFFCIMITGFQYTLISLSMLSSTTYLVFFNPQNQ